MAVRLQMALLCFVTVVLSADEPPVPIFGPKQYVIEAGKPQVFTDTLIVSDDHRCDGKAAFVLVMQNGNGLGSGSVASGRVSINGLSLLTERDFQQAAGLTEHAFVASAQNSLQVELTGGKPGSSITLSVRRDLEEPVAAPGDYVLPTNGEHTFTKQISGISPGPYWLVVENGEASGLRRVKHASITLNGNVVAGEQEITDAAPLFRRRVTLAPENVLHIRAVGRTNDVVRVSLKRPRTRTRADRESSLPRRKTAPA